MTVSIRADDNAIEPAIIQNYVFQVKTMVNFQLAIVTILLYDTVCNMDKEVKYFWSYPRKFVSMVYFANRYIGIFGALSLLPWFSLQADFTSQLQLLGKELRKQVFSLIHLIYLAHYLPDWITIVLMDYILMIRVLAFHSQNRKLAVLLKMALAVAAFSKLGVMIYGTLYQGMIVVNIANDATVCSNTRIATRLVGAIDWSIPLIYSTILMGLALHKAREFWELSSGFSGLSLVKILIVDQVLYFVLAVACFAVNIVLLQVTVPNVFLSALLDSIGSPTLLCVLGCHLLVHLKEAGEVGTNQGTSYRLKTITEIEHAQPPQKEMDDAL